MATQPLERNAIIVSPAHNHGTQRIQLSASAQQPVTFRDFADLEAEDVVAVIAGCSEVIFQDRMCGDFYVELSGPGFCVSAVHQNRIDALSAALASTPRRAA